MTSAFLIASKQMFSHASILVYQRHVFIHIEVRNTVIRLDQMHFSMYECVEGEVTLTLLKQLEEEARLTIKLSQLVEHDAIDKTALLSPAIRRA